MSPRPGKPAVSVLLPCRDAEPWLPACIESLEAQTLEGFEVLAVEDGSSDGTPDLLASWASRDARVRVLSSGGAGLVPALRLAAGRASGPLLARMDADDVAHPGRLAAQRELLERRPDVVACGTGVRLFPSDALGSGYRRYERWINSLRSPAELERDLFVECPIAHPALVIRASALRRAGGYADRGWPEDYDLLLRLHAAGGALANAPGELLRWRVRPDRLSRRSSRYGPDAFRRCKVHYLTRDVLPPGRPVVVWGAGRVGKAFARELRRAGPERPPSWTSTPGRSGSECTASRSSDPTSWRAGSLAGLAPTSWRPWARRAPAGRSGVRCAAWDRGSSETSGPWREGPRVARRGSGQGRRPDRGSPAARGGALAGVNNDNYSLLVGGPARATSPGLRPGRIWMSHTSEETEPSWPTPRNRT